MKTEIIQLIADAANRGQNDFDEEARLVDDLYLEDIDLVHLKLEVEDLIEQPIDDEAWLNCRTVQDIITLVGDTIATH